MPTDPTPLDADTAMLRALEWAEGKRSHNNLCHGLFDHSLEGLALREQTIAVMDAQEVVKWCAVAQALAAPSLAVVRALRGAGEKEAPR